MCQSQADDIIASRSFFLYLGINNVWDDGYGVILGS